MAAKEAYNTLIGLSTLVSLCLIHRRAREGGGGWAGGGGGWAGGLEWGGTSYTTPHKNKEQTRHTKKPNCEYMCINTCVWVQLCAYLSVCVF